jgi:hypothetical protein
MISKVKIGERKDADKTSKTSQASETSILDQLDR